ncbi:hypothetical protein EV702DRAFT_1205809 [Suillus placidus]|uniref:Uncharacterized protein n=1 Tax=Suillus placidus TaxID=48579 RepID=A0A9P7CVB0_9AGAM|nr:hypothetical protein EV702DRAFT_1205809 [Suillus placidus]
MADIEHQEGEGSTTQVNSEGQQAEPSQESTAAAASLQARQRRRIAQLEEKLESIAYIACQVQFALSSVTSWRSVDGDFDCIQFWRTIVDFFERPPGREARCRVDRLLEWWTRKVFGRNHCDDLSTTAKANMSVNALARQRAQRDDLSFDSP